MSCLIRHFEDLFERLQANEKAQKRLETEGTALETRLGKIAKAMSPEEKELARKILSKARWDSYLVTDHL